MSQAAADGQLDSLQRGARLPRHLIEETARLRSSWARHSPEMLRNYLVAGVQDPRTNLQSVLLRHFLIEGLLGDHCAALRHAEVRFAAVLTWLRQVLETRPEPEELAVLRHALKVGADNAEGTPIPAFVRQAFARLPGVVDGLEVPNYLAQALESALRQPGCTQPDEGSLNVFMMLWQQALASLPPHRLSVLEAGCGSANDFRFMVASGLARWLDYTGIDLCENNIATAQALCPEGRFRMGNLLAIDYPDKSFDFGLVQDVLEHLSLEALEVAVSELCRVVRRGLCLGFFQMYEGTEHIVRRVDAYHVNTLSLPRVRALLDRWGGRVQAIHIRTWLAHQFDWADAYWDTAYTLMVWL